MMTNGLKSTSLTFIRDELGIDLAKGQAERLDLQLTAKEDPAIRRIAVTKENDRIHLSYSHESLLYRALFIGLPRFLAQGETAYIEETPIIETSYSLDASRNGVMNLPTLKKFIAYLALLGYNTLYLYTEDTYEVADLPYFGYLRGAYTEAEISEIVAFAAEFGMEVVPSIQTLAHLTQFLKWYPNHELMDDGNTMLIGEEKVYDAIEKMIAACKKLYQTDRIHLGMDEAYQAGLGRYLSLYGYRDRTSLMIEHLDRVLAIAASYGVKPMIWSDFIYKLLDETGIDRYYNPDFKLKKAAAGKLPENLTYVHWDYGSDAAASYEKVIDNHLQFCDIEHYTLASGAHIWGSLAPNHGKTETIVTAAIKACRNKGVRSVMLTTWGDDGQETEHWHSLLGALRMADGVYSDKAYEDYAAIFDRLLGSGTYNMLSDLRYFDEVDTVTANNLMMTNISKLLLWQDPLCGIYDYHVASHNEKTPRSLGDYYRWLAETLATLEKNWQPESEVLRLIGRRYVLLAEVLSVKAELGVKLQAARIAANQDAMRILAADCLTLADKADELTNTHEAVWYGTYKTIGWEVLEQRYAALAHRLRTTARRIEGWLEGSDQLTELLAERLPFSNSQVPIEISGFNYRQGSVSGYN